MSFRPAVQTWRKWQPLENITGEKNNKITSDPMILLILVYLSSLAATYFSECPKFSIKSWLHLIEEIGWDVLIYWPQNWIFSWKGFQIMPVVYTVLLDTGERIAHPRISWANRVPKEQKNMRKSVRTAWARFPFLPGKSFSRLNVWILFNNRNSVLIYPLSSQNYNKNCVLFKKIEWLGL